MGRDEIGLHLVLGTFAMFGCLVSLVAAVDMGVPAGTAALITSLQPLATAALAGIVLREPVLGRQWLGLGVGLAGVILAIGGGLGTAPIFAFALAFLGTASITVATVIGKAKPSKSAFLPALTVQSLATAILLLPLAAGDGFWPEATPDFLLALGWFVVLSHDRCLRLLLGLSGADLRHARLEPDVSNAPSHGPPGPSSCSASRSRARPSSASSSALPAWCWRPDEFQTRASPAQT